jgi:hypothetical protein
VAAQVPAQAQIPRAEVEQLDQVAVVMLLAEWALAEVVQLLAWDEES